MPPTQPASFMSIVNGVNRSIPTEAIGSIPRSERLMALQCQFDAGQLDATAWKPLMKRQS